MKFVKLNAFQRIMRLWDRVHPYNAIQAFRVQGEPQIDRIQDAWRGTLRDMQLGRVVARGEEYSHTALDDHDRRGNLVLAQPGTSFDQFITSEMNFVFDQNDDCPFRAFVVREDGSHIVGVTYHHWVADSASVRWMLREWYLRIRNPLYILSRPATIASEGMWKLFGPDACGWHLDEALWGLLRYRTRFCRTRRISLPMTRCDVAVSHHVLPDGVGPRILSLARSSGLKFNDILVAAVSQAVHEFGVSPCTRDRDELAIGTVVDLRSMAGKKMPDTFGMFLGFTTTMLRRADLRDWDRLVRTIGSQNAWQKASKAPQTSVLRMAVGLAEAKLVSPRRWAELYRDRMPVAAGVSNVNMNRDWAAAYHPAEIADYFRVSPTGPMIPLLVTPTTLGEKMNFLITRQTSLVNDTRCQNFVSFLRDRLIQLAEKVR
jgi:hypothetical protein